MYQNKKRTGEQNTDLTAVTANMRKNATVLPDNRPVSSLQKKQLTTMPAAGVSVVQQKAKLLQLMKPSFNLKLGESVAVDPFFKSAAILGDVLEHFESMNDESVVSMVGGIKMHLLLAKSTGVDKEVRNSALQLAIESSIKLVRYVRDRKLIMDQIPEQLFSMISSAAM